MTVMHQHLVSARMPFMHDDSCMIMAAAVEEQAPPEDQSSCRQGC